VFADGPPDLFPLCGEPAQPVGFGRKLVAQGGEVFNFQGSQVAQQLSMSLESLLREEARTL